MNDEPKPADDLVRHLTADFMDPQDRATLENPELPPNSLKRFVAGSISHEEIEERLTSDENARIGLEIEGLLGGAFITDSFRDFISHTVRYAHAMKNKVPETIEPASLGLTVPGGSIFDEEAAPEIEAQCLRRYVYDVVRRLVFVGQDGEGKSIKVIVSPNEFENAMSFVDHWQEQYEAIHGASPFEGMDLEAFDAAAQEVTVVSAESPGGQAWGSFIEKLKQSKQPQRDDKAGGNS